MESTSWRYSTRVVDLVWDRRHRSSRRGDLDRVSRIICAERDSRSRNRARADSSPSAYDRHAPVHAVGGAASMRKARKTVNLPSSRPFRLVSLSAQSVS